jgi:hypothetical protein
MIACPRNHQDRTVTSIGSGGFVLLGEGYDLRQCAAEDDVGVAALSAEMNSHVINHRANDTHGLWFELSDHLSRVRMT